MTDQPQREAALNRRVGLRPEGQESLTAFNNAQNDWRGVCRRCGAALEGTLVELREHRCDG